MNPNATLTYGEYTFQGVFPDQVDTVPTRAGILLIQDRVTGKSEVCLTASMRQRVKQVYQGNVGVVLRSRYHGDWAAHLRVYYYPLAMAGNKRWFTMVDKARVERALGEDLLVKPPRHSRATSHAVIVVAHEPSGEYYITIRADNGPGWTMMGHIRMLNRYRSTRSHRTNRPLMEFVTAHGPFRENHGLQIALHEEGFTSRDEAIERAQEIARERGPDRLLTTGILRIREWSHPAWKRTLADSRRLTATC